MVVLLAEQPDLILGGPRAVLFADGVWHTGDDLRREIDLVSATLITANDGLLLLAMRPDLESVTTYLAALQTGRAVALIDPGAAADVVQRLADVYQPALVGGVSRPLHGFGLGARRWQMADLPAAPVNERIALLLPTSGSTGSPRMVRLSRAAVLSNATSIAETLGISSGEIAPTSLPLFYSYGLSVLNSHLFSGAGVALTFDSILSREFWDTFDQAGCTSLAGVPYSYQILKRLGFAPTDHPTLRTLTQAGGKLAIPFQQHFHELMSSVGGRFYVMYGQTEGTARLAIMPSEELPARWGSVGRPLSPGTIDIVVDGRTVDRGLEGDVIFSGPNVMDGYADNADDLSLGDELLGHLATGDRGFLDDDGYLWLTGRSKRIAKVFGERVNLDDVESMLRDVGVSAVAVALDDKLVLIAEGEIDLVVLKKSISSRIGVHSSGVTAMAVDQLPLLPSGKIDYQAVQRMASG